MAKKNLFNEPTSQEREYLRLLTSYARSLASDVRSTLIPKIGELLTEKAADERGDDWADTLAELLLELEAMANGHSAVLIEKLPGQFNAVSKFNDGQFRMIVKAKTGIKAAEATGVSGPLAIQQSLGIDVYRAEPYLEPLRKAWVLQNTDLVKSIPTKLHGELRGIIDRGVANGFSVKQLQDEIAGRFGVTESRAKLIAQDQILKANASLTQERLKSVGVDSYIWRTVGDSRVRPTHAEREGQVFRWDNPPSDGHPGNAVRCRCRAEAIWEE